MDDRGIADEGVSVLLRGQFDPLKTSPTWFSTNGLVGPTELEHATIRLIAPEFSDFDLGWLSIQIAPDFVQLATKLPEEFERLRDAATSFLRALGEIPVSQLTILRYYHIVMPQQSMDAIGDALLPKTFWEDSMRFPATKDVSVVAVRSDGNSGAVQVTVQPSNIVKSAVFIAVSDQFSMRSDWNSPVLRKDATWDMDPQATEASVERYAIALSILDDSWHDSISRSDALQKKIVDIGVPH